VTARLWFGVSSWNFKDWIGPFYPPGTNSQEMLATYARVFPTVEVDSSFYGIPRQTTIERWRERVGSGFRFSLKTPSAVTHERRFIGAGKLFSIFLERVKLLGDKLGPVLIQCPPDFAPTAENRMALFEFLETELPAGVRVALELRDTRWYDEVLFAQAKRIGCTLALTEGSHADVAHAARIAGELASGAPADFAYVRWLGTETFEYYDRVQADRSASLDAWERLLRPLQDRLIDIFAYASNDYQGYAPATARAMLARLGQPIPAETVQPRLL
jgi:uncharacterized protein YecE (DUF72 family)